MMERRIRDAVAMLLSRGARALERTAGELEQAAADLRRDEAQAPDEAERVWSEREPDTMIRSAPLRAVPDTPTDEPSGTEPGNGRHVPPVRPPRLPDRERPGDVDAEVAVVPPVPGTDVAGGDDRDADRLRAMARGTVSEIRARLSQLSPDELRQLRDIEVVNRNRTTLLTAIDRALEPGA